MATRDYSPLHSPSHAQPHLHAPTRHHFPSPSSSTPPPDSTVADYYHPSFSDIADDSSDHAKSTSAVNTPNSKRSSSAGPTAGGNSPYHYNNKKPKPSSTGGADHDSSFHGGDYRKDREEWSDTAIACLLDAYTEKFNQLNRGNLRGRDWEEVAEAVGERCGSAVAGGGKCNRKHKSYKSVEQCKNKIDNLKKRYKVEVQRIGSCGISTSHWHWFKKLEAIVGNSITVKIVSDDERGVSNSSYMPRQSKNRYAPSNAILATNLKPKPTSNLKWHRVLIKISGSALAGNCQNIDPKVPVLFLILLLFDSNWILVYSIFERF
ncbi:putative transcription factor Trihelix family [Lupinus albus]|uniref:Putative transcription factor Trihelix family n=1 Tax=Lupinus albus TaxID=3870 RepID=A0A6A4QEX2_LUPAL|nr:putative transcription factor Trihelix family [Lupinus albus]